MGKTGQGVFLRGNEKNRYFKWGLRGGIPKQFPHNSLRGDCVGIVWGLFVADLGGSVRQGCF